MSQPNTADDGELLNVLQWIGTTLEKNNDVLMSILAHHDAETADFIDYVHNTKYVFLNEQSEEALGALFEEYQQSKVEKDA